jgi:hypothetical protein
MQIPDVQKNEHVTFPNPQVQGDVAQPGQLIISCIDHHKVSIKSASLAKSPAKMFFFVNVRRSRLHTTRQQSLNADSLPLKNRRRSRKKIGLDP